MRVELIHPMLVHFPIALLSTGVLLRFAALLLRKKATFSFLRPASWVVLALGVMAAWMAVIAGELAESIVGPTLPNRDILHEHTEHAYLTAYGFTIALLIDWARAFLIYKRQKRGWMIKRGLAATAGVLYLLSLTNLMITGFYGGTLVYEEGAAVKKTSTGIGPQ
jgi:uncharacterized membrane protein